MPRPIWRHLCVDMQRMFYEQTPWHVEWMGGVLPAVEEVVGRYARETIVTRFMPPIDASSAPGAWQSYYKRWESMTLHALPKEMVEVIPSLRKFIPPARIFDKTTYSPWTSGQLHRILSQEHVSSVVVSGGETDVCVLGTVLGAIDLGYHVVVLSDAVCSGADATHDAALKLLRDRFAIQLEMMTTESFLSIAR